MYTLSVDERAFIQTLRVCGIALDDVKYILAMYITRHTPINDSKVDAAVDAIINEWFINGQKMEVVYYED